MEKGSSAPARLAFGLLMTLGSGNGCKDCGASGTPDARMDGSPGKGNSGETSSDEELPTLNEDPCANAGNRDTRETIFPLPAHLLPIIDAMIAREDIRKAFGDLLDKGDPRGAILPIPQRLDRKSLTPQVAKNLAGLFHRLIVQACSGSTFVSPDQPQTAIGSQSRGYDVKIFTDTRTFDSEAIIEDLVVGGNEMSRLLKMQCMETQRRLYAILLAVFRPYLSCESNFVDSCSRPTHRHYAHSIGCQAPRSEETKPLWQRDSDDALFTPDGGSDATAPSGRPIPLHERILNRPQPTRFEKGHPANRQQEKPFMGQNPPPWLRTKLGRRPMPYPMRRVA